ncbi:unnamed protein product [Psylliodes chrysocephalus]|uniref:SWIM-type domain-containing protein n=1 Tax=Psylliodes chrysocephalus TaxID=3402493 RepID=A0A9P0CXD3_9CUCU|nr:unnamed protein product [Psylliodes chrysocephala]
MSIQDALLALSSKINRSLDDSNACLCIFIDLSKDFDTVGKFKTNVKNSILTVISCLLTVKQHGHIKSIFNFLKQTIPVQHVPSIGDYYRIAVALINRYHPTIHMNGADAELAFRIIEKAREPDIVQAFVNVNNLFARNINRWVRMDTVHLMEFPQLTLEYLQDLTTGVYQVNLAPSYVQDKLQRDADEKFQFEMLRGENNLPERGLLRVRVYSRFRNATKHQLCITVKPNDEIEGNEEDYEFNRNEEPIFGYYCTCPSDARTVGTCVYVASVLWFLGYARHEANIRYPSTSLVNTIRNARNRPQ